MRDVPIVSISTRRSFLRGSGGISIAAATCSSGCLTYAVEHTETPTQTPKPIPTFDSSHGERFPDVTIIESRVHEVTNEFRSEKGLSVWGYDDDLAGIARAYSRDMAKRNYFSHVNPEGQTAPERCEEFGYYGYPIGENLAKREIQTEQTGPDYLARKLVGQWKRSTGHRRELLSDLYVEEGVGIYITAEGIVYATTIQSGEDAEVA